MSSLQQKQCSSRTGFQYAQVCFLGALVLASIGSCSRMSLTGAPAAIRCEPTCESSFPVTSVLTSVTKTLTLSNAGGTSASALSLTGLDGPFSIEGGWPGNGGTCGDSMDASSESCTVVIKFSPTVGGVFSADLTLSYDSGEGVETVSVALEGTALPQGSLDPSFNGNGKSLMDFGGDQVVRDLSLTDEGKLILAGDADDGAGGARAFTVTRLNEDGKLDPTFGSGGVITTPVGIGINTVSSSAVNSYGGVTLLGNTGSGMALVRYQGDGSLDLTFGLLGGGINLINSLLVGSNESGHRIAPYDGGKLIVVGQSLPLVGTSVFFVMRASAIGIPDILLPSFGSLTGVQFVSFGIGRTDKAHGVAVRADGRIVVGGGSSAGGSTRSALAALEADGDLDPSFGSGTGKVLLDLCAPGADSEINDVVLQGDGKIVVAGYCVSGAQKDMLAARFNATGGLDSSFGTSGVTKVDFSGYDDVANRVVIQPDGKVILGGYSNNGTYDHLALVRLTSSGALDTAFGTNGKITDSLSAGNARGLALALQSDGKILLGGYAAGAGGKAYAIIRYLP